MASARARALMPASAGDLVAHSPRGGSYVIRSPPGRGAAGPAGTIPRRRAVLPSDAMSMDTGRLLASIQRAWEGDALPTLADYIRIPAKSRAFDPAWREHGHIDRAVGLVEGWARARPIEGLRVEVVRLEGRTPVLLLE